MFSLHETLRPQRAQLLICLNLAISPQPLPWNGNVGVCMKEVGSSWSLRGGPCAGLSSQFLGTLAWGPPYAVGQHLPAPPLLPYSQPAFPPPAGMAGAGLCSLSPSHSLLLLHLHTALRLSACPCAPSSFVLLSLQLLEQCLTQSFLVQ